MFRRLAQAMGYAEPCFSDSDEKMIRELLDPEFNPLFEGVTYEKLEQQGWARAAVDSPRRRGINSGRWPTPSGKIEIYSETLAKLGLDPLPTHLVEQEGFEDAELRRVYPLQVISAATHYFIGATFQHVARLQEMTARATFELSPRDAHERGITDGDLCRLYNDRGETFGYALVVEGLLPGVVGAPKQLRGSKMPNGVNLNALTSQEVADMGGGPVFYSTLAQIEKVAEPSAIAINSNV
jgi:anaerobic selenocysteine-containing dehydrogenase